MKLKTFSILTFLSAALFLGVSEAKQPIEYYQFKIVEAEEKGDYLSIVNVLNELIDEYDGTPAELQAKGYLYNLYQGKCDKLALSNGFLQPKPSDEHKNKCLAMTNLPKMVSLMEELVVDLENALDLNNDLDDKDKKWLYKK